MGFIHSPLSRKQHINNLIIEASEQEERSKIFCSIDKKDENNKSGTRRRTVMICDDERDLLLMFAIELETKYNVMTAASGEECIQKYVDERHKGRKIDLILLDYRLGDIMGDTVARKIKELNDVKIILISAYDLDQQLICNLKENEYVVEVLKKPFTIESLMQVIVQKIGI
jgi:CheY-like chemotaxis protein